MLTLAADPGVGHVILMVLAFRMQRSKVIEAHTQISKESLWGRAVYGLVWDAVNCPGDD